MSSKNNKMKGDKQLIIHRARSYGWEMYPLEEQKNPFMLSFRKDGIRLNIYWTGKGYHRKPVDHMGEQQDAMLVDADPEFYK